MLIYIHGVFKGTFKCRIWFGIERTLPETSNAGNVCKRRKRNLRKGRRPSAEVSSWIYVCCVLTASLERIITPLCAGLIRWIVFFSHQAALPTLWDGHTSIAQCSTKCCVKRPHLRVLSFLNYYYLRSKPRRTLAFSACRRRKMASKRYDITTEQTGLVIYWEVYMSTHTRQSQWYTKKSSETYMEWPVAFFIIVLLTTQ